MLSTIIRRAIDDQQEGDKEEYEEGEEKMN